MTTSLSRGSSSPRRNTLTLAVRSDIRASKSPNSASKDRAKSPGTLPGLHLNVGALRFGGRLDFRRALEIRVESRVLLVIRAGASQTEKKTDDQGHDGNNHRHHVGDNAGKSARTAMTAIGAAVCIAGKGAATFTASDNNHDRVNRRMLVRFASRCSSLGWSGVGEAISESKWRSKGKCEWKSSLEGGTK